MSVSRTLLGVAGGAVATGAAVAVGVTRASARRRYTSSEGLPLAVPADRNGTIAADDGVGLYYEEVGATAAPLTVVFAHGFCLSMGAFLYQRRALADHFGDQIRMVFYDQRSHGASGRSDPGGASIDQLGRDLAVVLDTLAPAGPVMLVGHSMGGMTVLALAEAHPDRFAAPGRIGSVALLSTSTGKLSSVTFGFPAALARVRGPVLPLLLRGARRQAGLVERGRAVGTDVARMVTRHLSFARDVSPSLVEYCTQMIARTSIEVIADFYPTLMAHDKLQALSALGDCEVVIVCGDHDLITPVQHSRDIAAGLPKAQLVEIRHAGHMALMEAADDVTAPLLDLVDAQLSANAPTRWWRRG